MHEGRWLLNPRATLASAGVRAGATLTLALRALRGGGGDGGATGAESRSAYLEMYADGGGKGYSTKRETLGGFVRYSTQSTVRDRDEREEELARDTVLLPQLRTIVRELCAHGRACGGGGKRRVCACGGLFCARPGARVRVAHGPTRCRT